MIITSIDNKRIKEIKKLRNQKYSKENNLFIVETEHLVNEADINGCIKYKICLESYTGSINEDDIIVNDKVMRNLSNLQSYPKVMAVCSYKENNINLGNKIIILDNVQDPGNLGTIIRTSKAFGFNTIILSNDSVSKYNEKVIRSSEGMIFKTNIIETDLKDIIEYLKKENYQVYGTNVINGIDVKELNKKEKIAFILGNEGNGVSKEIQSIVDKNIYIDINKDCESLNVAVAGAIIMYELGDK